MKFYLIDDDRNVLNILKLIIKSRQLGEVCGTAQSGTDGLDRYSGSYDDAYLLGPTYSFHSKDWSFTGSVTAMYKVIPGNAKNMHNFQLTGVWNWTFCKGMLSFNGFADFWMENRPWQL